ncbi:hypothetical protein [Priestia endophytica]|uniref:hypothetical protein n=1 Tax=Priestia endophytica TaxID=135735 RepID=UPI000F53EC28|nr:hypothetical protein [Priestia endophytica]
MKMEYIAKKSQSLHLTVLNFLYSLMAVIRRPLTSSNKSHQKNAIAIWITVVIAIIVGGLTIAGLMWACEHFIKGGYFKGSYHILGSKVDIQCGRR